MVGMTGFEPVTFCTQNKRATKLRYIPFHQLYYVIVQNPCLVFQYYDFPHPIEDTISLAISSFWFLIVIIIIINI